MRPIVILRWAVGVGAVLLLVFSFLTQPAVVSWTLTSVTGLLLSTWLANESRHDLRLLPRSTNGRRTSAWGRLARESMRASAHLVWLGAGLIALDILPLPKEWIVPALIYGNVSTGINSVIDARLRFLLYRTRDAEPTIPH